MDLPLFYVVARRKSKDQRFTTLSWAVPDATKRALDWCTKWRSCRLRCGPEPMGLQTPAL